MGKITPSQIRSAFVCAICRLNPRYLLNNPVLFVTYITCLFMTGLCGYTFINTSLESPMFIFHITIWLWFTVIFANFSESLAESQGKAQVQTLKKTRKEIDAKKIQTINDRNSILVPATSLVRNDLVYVVAGDTIPGDGQVLEGIATVDESAITGESAPVIREKGEDRNSVTGGTVVLSDWLVIKILFNPGETFLDRMIMMVEGAKRQKTPNEIALSILLAGMSLIFLIVIMTLYPFCAFSIMKSGKGAIISLTVLISLLVCLIPTTISGLLSAIGIAGMERLIRHNVIATSGRAVEAAGDVQVLLLDKTGTITMGNRQAIAFYPAPGISMNTLAKAALLSSLSDDTPEGKSIVVLAKTKYHLGMTTLDSPYTSIPFCAQTRISGIVFDHKKILKGSLDKMILEIKNQGGTFNEAVIQKAEEIARGGSTPLIVSDNQTVLGTIELKDVIKPDIKHRLADLRMMGIKSIMITGDNPLTAANIANEAGVDDFYAQATPEMKLSLIRELQMNGQLVAMVGDGTNDAPALAQTDVAVAMNSGTQAAKEAANMIDLDSDPTKLLDIVKIGKQLLITRGALTTFSMANDVAKYFAIIPAAFTTFVPELNMLNIMRLSSPENAVLSAVIFNALIIIFLIPLALRGITYSAMNADTMLRNHVFIYGLGGIVAPFVGIKVIDTILKLL